MKIGVLTILLVLLPLAASAKSTRETTYRYEQIWNTAVRFLRVDNGFPIIEKDRRSGYLMFDYKDNGSKQIGSMELIETVRENRKSITIGLRIHNMPSYIEVMLLDKLERKLRDEYGDPPIAMPIADAASKREKQPVDDPDGRDADGPDAESDDPSDAKRTED